MSWSTSTSGPKKDIDSLIDNLGVSGELEGPGIDQLYAAKRAAKELVKTIPGPNINVSLSGHANGVGWNEKKGWANDCISVSVTQIIPKE